MQHCFGPSMQPPSHSTGHEEALVQNVLLPPSLPIYMPLADGRLNIDFHRLLIKASFVVVVVEVVGPSLVRPLPAAIDDVE